MIKAMKKYGTALGCGVFLGVAISHFTSPSYAQQPAAPTQYTLTVTPQELSAIGAALSDRPYKDVATLLVNLERQVQAQQAKAAEPKADLKPDAPKPEGDAK